MIYLNIGNSVVLNTLGVPVINSFEHLCEQLSVTEQLLYFLTYKKKYCYFEKKIPKKDKTERTLNVPSLSLKVVQRWILKEILEKIYVSEQAMAFIPHKNGLRENAERHKKNIFLLEMDITNFFGTITEQQVYRLFCNIGYNSKVAGVLANLCTYDGYLPQGAVTSPYIANLVCYHMDARINGYCSRKDIVYTRYADDLTFSSNNRTLLNKVEKFIKYIVADEGFKINDKKTRYLSNDVKKTVTGITVNDDSIHVDKKFKKDLRALADHFDHSLIMETGSLKQATEDALLAENLRIVKVDFRPTAENFAKYIYDEMTSRGYNVIEASVYETPNNVASYCE